MAPSVPHAVGAAPVSHVLPFQHPVQHAPPRQRPPGHGVASAGAHDPALHVVHAPHVSHAPPPVPHAVSASPNMHRPPMLHPVQHAPPTQRPPAVPHVMPSLDGSGAHAPLVQVPQPSHARQRSPARPHASFMTPVTHAVPFQHPSQQLPPQHAPLAHAVPSSAVMQVPSRHISHSSHVTRLHASQPASEAQSLSSQSVSPSQSSSAPSPHAVSVARHPPSTPPPSGAPAQNPPLHLALEHAGTSNMRGASRTTIGPGVGSVASVQPSAKSTQASSRAPPPKP
jgi:hypothetical protein